MSTITREFTKEQLKHIIETDHAQCGEASALARIALASLDAEALAYLTNSASMAEVITSHHFGGDSVSMRRVAESSKWKPLFTAPPAPVSVPTFEEWCKRTEQKPVGWVHDAMKEAYDACRAAMLHGADGNSPVVTDGLNIRAVAALREAVRNQWLKSDEFAEKIYWKNMHDIANEIVVAMLAAAPQQECKHEFVYGWHSYGSKSGYQCRFCGKLQEAKP